MNQLTKFINLITGTTSTTSRRFWHCCATIVILTLASLAYVPQAQARSEMFVGNALANSVEEYDGRTGVFIITFVSSGSGGLSGPQNLTVGPDGNLYVTSHDTNSVKRYDGETGAFIDDFVPSGSGGLANPDQLIFGPDGKLYVSNRFAGAIKRYNGLTGAFIDTFVSDSRLFGFTVVRHFTWIVLAKNANDRLLGRNIAKRFSDAVNR